MVLLTDVGASEYIICIDCHYNDVIMGAIASQITSLTIVYSIDYSDGDQRKHKSSASLAFVQGIHRRPVNSPHKWPVTRKMFPFDDVIMCCHGSQSVRMLWGGYVQEGMCFLESIRISITYRADAANNCLLMLADKHVNHKLHTPHKYSESKRLYLPECLLKPTYTLIWRL